MPVDDEGRHLLPPAPDSVWCRLLDLAFAEAGRFGGGQRPVVRYGHPPVGLTLKEAKEEHHVMEEQCRFQPARRKMSGRIVVWPLTAWYGHTDGDELVIDAYAEVVWES